MTPMRAVNEGSATIDFVEEHTLPVPLTFLRQAEAACGPG